MAQVIVLLAAVITTMIFMGAVAISAVGRRTRDLKRISHQLDTLNQALKTPDQIRTEARLREQVEARNRVLLGIGSEY